MAFPKEKLHDRFLFSPILTAICDLTTYQANHTMNILKQSRMLLDCLATYPDAKICFYVSNIQLYIESNISYLVLPGVKRKIEGYFYLHVP